MKPVAAHVAAFLARLEATGLLDDLQEYSDGWATGDLFERLGVTKMDRLRFALVANYKQHYGGPMRKCSACHQEKPEDEFKAYKTGTFRKRCTACMDAQRKRIARQARYDELKGDLFELHRQKRFKDCAFIARQFRDELGVIVEIDDDGITLRNGHPE